MTAPTWREWCAAQNVHPVEVLRELVRAWPAEHHAGRPHRLAHIDERVKQLRPLIVAAAAAVTEQRRAAGARRPAPAEPGPATLELQRLVDEHAAGAGYAVPGSQDGRMPSEHSRTAAPTSARVSRDGRPTIEVYQ